MDWMNKIAERIDSFRDEMIDMQIQLCSFPAISPASGGEGEVRKAECLLEFLKANGFSDVSVIKAPDMDSPAGYRPNILAIYKGKSSAKTIWIMTHLDVVPPGELELWNGNPYKAWVEEGKIFGRGVEDNQQDMVASLYALKAFFAEGIIPEYDVGIALVADEETGSEKGIDYVLQKSNPFRKQDLIIVPDAGNKDGTITGQHHLGYPGSGQIHFPTGSPANASARISPTRAASSGPARFTNTSDESDIRIPQHCPASTAQIQVVCARRKRKVQCSLSLFSLQRPSYTLEG